MFCGMSGFADRLMEVGTGKEIVKPICLLWQQKKLAAIFARPPRVDKSFDPPPCSKVAASCNL